TLGQARPFTPENIEAFLKWSTAFGDAYEQYEKRTYATQIEWKRAEEKEFKQLQDEIKDAIQSNETRIASDIESIEDDNAKSLQEAMMKSSSITDLIATKYITGISKLGVYSIPFKQPVLRLLACALRLLANKPKESYLNATTKLPTWDKLRGELHQDNLLGLFQAFNIIEIPPSIVQEAKDLLGETTQDDVESSSVYLGLLFCIQIVVRSVSCKSTTKSMSGSSKKRRTLADADEDLRLYQARLAEARNKMILLARENARMKVLLQKYMEKDDSLMSSSQMSSATSTLNLSQPLSQNTISQSTFQLIQEQKKSQDDNSSLLDANLPDDLMFDSSFGTSQDLSVPSLGHDDFVFDSQLSQLEEVANTSHLDDILSFLEKQEALDTERLFTVQNEVVELRKSMVVPRVGVGVLIYSPKHPNCVLIGVRKGSHGAGKLALPGGHLEFGESWEECAIREVKEETNLDISKCTLAFTTNDVMEEYEKHYITIFMQTTISENQIPELMEPDKCEGWIWQDYASLKTPELQARLFLPLQQLTHSSYSVPKLLAGFPPKSVVGDDNALITSLGITTGSVVLLKEGVVLSSSIPSSGKFQRKVIAGDNSCLFNAIGFCLGNGDTNNGSTMRNVVVNAIKNDPNMFNAIFLGKPVDEYCTWILDDKSWGGEIELSILSMHFKVEMLVFDVISMSRLCYGEDQGFTQRLFLLYDGIHYDAITEVDSRGNNKTLFAINDFVKVENASVLAVEAHQTHQYTDLGNFTIRCMICRRAFKGQIEASAHAQESGHYEFGEIQS
ncbi:ubiquitin thioesterase OTU1, partial [Thraustotheca clavata]